MSASAGPSNGMRAKNKSNNERPDPNFAGKNFIHPSVIINRIKGYNTWKY
jgi:hypothetical protein